MVAMNRYQRKAVFVGARVRYGDVAEAVGCNISTVSRIANGLTVRETDTTERVKRELAKRAGVSVEQLWPSQSTASAA